MSWFYFALLAPLLWAIVVIIDDNLIRDVYKSAHFGTIISGLFNLIALAIPFIVQISRPDVDSLVFALSAGFLLVVFYFFYFRTLELTSPSIVQALLNLTVIFIPILSYFVLDEVLNTQQYLGFLIVFVSAFALSALDIRKFTISKSLTLAFLGSIVYAASAILSKLVYNNLDFWTGYYWISVGMIFGGFFFMFTSKEGRRFPSELKKHAKKWIGLFAITEAINLGAILSQNFALSRGPVTIVKVLEGMLPAFILILALIMYPFFPAYLREATERGAGTKLVLMAVMVVGIFLIERSF